MLDIGGDKFPLESRKLLSSPGKNISFRCDPSEINISDEMPKTTVWKALSINSGNTKEKRSSLLTMFSLCLSLSALDSSDVWQFSHKYNKNLLFNHTMEWLCRQFIHVQNKMPEDRFSGTT
ncbi:electroneutral sodium bicarbonate exchanger 1-like protein [Cricetulus griseus]|nr:electroneutral sodium bicarbonate exchanger 1-like protein [Cricetulus griseus]